MYLGYFRYGTVDIVNDARTAAYAGGLVRCEGCADLAVAAGESFGYSNPIADQAPWAIGNSVGGCFYGLVIREITNLYEATFKRSVTEAIGKGGIPTGGRNASKVMAVTARAVASTEGGMDAGLEWLNQALTRPCGGDDCTGASAHFFDCCPEICEDESGTPEEQVSAVRRRFDNVVIVDGPRELERVVLDRGVFSVIEWTMVATDPFMYRDASPLWEGSIGQAPVFLAAGATMLASSTDFAQIDCEPPSTSLTTCADDPSCPLLLSPPSAPTVPGCDPDVTVWERQWMRIKSVLAGSGEKVITGTYTNESGFGQTIRIRLWHEEDFATECAFEQEVWVDYVPPGATVTIGEGGQVLVTCNGDVVNATRNVRGNYRGPYAPLVVGCARNWVAAFDVAGGGTEHEWDVSLVQRSG